MNDKSEHDRAKNNEDDHAHHLTSTNIHYEEDDMSQYDRESTQIDQTASRDEPIGSSQTSLNTQINCADKSTLDQSNSNEISISSDTIRRSEPSTSTVVSTVETSSNIKTQIGSEQQMHREIITDPSKDGDFQIPVDNEGHVYVYQPDTVTEQDMHQTIIKDPGKHGDFQMSVDNEGHAYVYHSYPLTEQEMHRAIVKDPSKHGDFKVPVDNEGHVYVYTSGAITLKLLTINSVSNQLWMTSDGYSESNASLAESGFEKDERTSKGIQVSMKNGSTYICYRLCIMLMLLC